MPKLRDGLVTTTLRISSLSVAICQMSIPMLLIKLGESKYYRKIPFIRRVL